MVDPYYLAGDLLEEANMHVVKARSSFGKLYRLLRKVSSEDVDNPQYLVGVTKALRDQLEQVEHQIAHLDTFLDN